MRGRRVFIVVAVCTVMSVAPVFGLSEKKKQEASDSIEALMASVGCNVKVKITDVDNNGVLDFMVACLPGGENATTVAWYLGALTGAIGRYTRSSGWPSDEEVIWATTTRECRCCFKLAEDGASDVEIGACVFEIWQRID